MSIDVFDAAAKIAETLECTNDIESRRAIQMALVFLDKADLLVDPNAIAVNAPQWNPVSTYSGDDKVKAHDH